MSNLIVLTKKPKRQKRWRTEAEILKAIDAVYRKIGRYSMFAQTQLDLESLAKDCDIVACKNHREKADQFLGKIKRLKETRLPKLQLLLAEMRTPALGEKNGVEGLNAVECVLQNK